MTTERILRSFTRFCLPEIILKKLALGCPVEAKA